MTYYNVKFKIFYYLFADDVNFYSVTSILFYTYIFITRFRTSSSYIYWFNNRSTFISCITTKKKKKKTSLDLFILLGFSYFFQGFWSLQKKKKEKTTKPFLWCTVLALLCPDLEEGHITNETCRIFTSFGNNNNNNKF